MKKWLKVTLAAAVILLILGGVVWTVSYGLGARPGDVFNDQTLDLPDGVHMSFGSGGSSGIFVSDRHGFGSGGLNSAVSPDGEYSLSAEGIDSISIDWLSGSARVVVTNDSRITISESTGGGISEEHALRYSTEDGTLRILYCSSVSGLSFNLPSKDLVLSLPAALAEHLTDFAFSSTSASLDVSGLNVSGCFDFDSTSGGLSAERVNAGSVSVDTVSGGTSFLNGSADELDMSTTSGKVEASGRFDRIDADTVSGSVTLDCDVCPRELEVETASGSVKLTLPKGSGFTVEYDTTSGSFQCDFAVISRGGTHIAGSGSAEFDVDTVSGSLTIREG